MARQSDAHSLLWFVFPYHTLGPTFPTDAARWRRQRVVKVPIRAASRASRPEREALPFASRHGERQFSRLLTLERHTETILPRERGMMLSV